MFDVEFERAFDAATHHSGDRYVRTFWQLQRLLGIGAEAELKRALDTIRAFSHEVIESRRALPAEAQLW